MSLESLQDYFQRRGKEETYSRAWAAHELSQRLKKLTGFEVKVILQNGKMRCVCGSNTEAAALHFRLPEILKAYQEVTADKAPIKVTIRAAG